MVSQVSNRCAVNRSFLSGFLKTAIMFVVVTTACFATSLAVDTQAQANPMPRRTYYMAFEDFYQGRFKIAQATMRSHSRSGAILVNGRFLDSVCYWTMLGESYYRVGEYALALEQYEAALELYLGLQMWTSRTEFPEIVQDKQGAVRRSQVPWAVSGRNPRYGAFNRSMLVRLGKSPAENDDALRRGGVFDPERFQSVDIGEVMRVVSLAIYRRHMIMGPISSVDPFTRRLTTSLVGSGGANIPAAWTGIPKGIALAAQGENNRATQLLRSSLQIGGFDHPLTPIALLTLGKIAANQNQTDNAQKLFMEASIAAAAFEQYDIVAEALNYGALIHVAPRTMQPYQPLVAAIDWARRINKNALQASLLTTAAMVAAESGDANSASALLQKAKSEMRRNDISRSAIYTNWLYVNTMVNYLQADVQNGDKQFGEYLQAARATSFWLFQIALADNAVRDGNVTEREAEVLYDALLHEPTDADWSFRPEEAMVFLATPHYEPMERWFQIALSRKAEEKAIGISELIRRQRFFSALPMGGRLVSLRWVLEAPIAALSQKAREQKATLLLRYPEFKSLSDQANGLTKQLAELPIAPEAGTDEHQRQKQLLAALAMVVNSQEIVLRKISLMRDPCELAFPRPLTIPQIQQKLKPDQVIISFLKAGQVYYVMKLSANRYTIESQIQAKVLDRKIIQLTKAINVGDKASINAPETFLNDDWRTIAGEISELIFARTEPQAIDTLKEIIVIPDGKVWYLPMEILQLGSPGSSVNLNDRVRIRYAPMAALAIPDDRTPSRFRRSGVVVDRNFLRDDKDQVAKGAADLLVAIPDIEQIQKTIQGPSALLAATIDQLVVWHLSSEKSRGVFSFSPMQVDAGRAGADLRSWMMLPWKGVDQIILSGVSSAIEGSSRARADGSELFLLTTALMASGTRTILISRWRVGGQSCLDLTRELVAELANLSASDAWYRSLGLFKDSDIDITVEPRVQEKVIDEPLKAEHPFFWAGYMLIDTGYEPGVSEPTEAEAGVDTGK